MLLNFRNQIAVTLLALSEYYHHRYLYIYDYHKAMMEAVNIFLMVHTDILMATIMV